MTIQGILRNMRQYSENRLGIQQLREKMFDMFCLCSQFQVKRGSLSVNKVS